MVYVFLANGFEEVEALAPVDLLRRGGVEVKTVGISGREVTGAHGITVIADITADEADTAGLEGVVLPGGMPGTLNLEKSETVKRFLKFAAENGLLTGAICAAPSVLGHLGLLRGKRATCFSGFEPELEGATLVEDIPAVTDGNTVTARGAGAAIDFGLALLAVLKGKQAAEDMRKAFRYGNQTERNLK